MDWGIGQFRCPQQLPGPAQPAAIPGADPQQAVSPGPGIPCRLEPVREEGADNMRLTLVPPQAAQEAI